MLRLQLIIDMSIHKLGYYNLTSGCEITFSRGLMPLKRSLRVIPGTAGLEIKVFSLKPKFDSYHKVLCIETSTSLGSLQKFEVATGEFEGALGSSHPLISSTVPVPIPTTNYPRGFQSESHSSESYSAKS